MDHLGQWLNNFPSLINVFLLFKLLKVNFPHNYIALSADFENKVYKPSYGIGIWKRIRIEWVELTI